MKIETNFTEKIIETIPIPCFLKDSKNDIILIYDRDDTEFIGLFLHSKEHPIGNAKIVKLEDIDNGNYKLFEGTITINIK